MSDESLDEVEQRIDDLMNGLLDEAFKILKSGSPQNKVMLMKQVIPVLMKERGDRQLTQAQEETRASIEKMFGAVRSTLPQRAQIADVPMDTVDGS